MSKKAFDKFINKPERGAKKKERIRQEKKKIRAEKNAYFDEQKRLAKERRYGKTPDNRAPAAPRDNRQKTAGERTAPGKRADIQKSRTPQREFKKPAPDHKRTQTRTDGRDIISAHQKDNTRAASQEWRQGKTPDNRNPAGKDTRQKPAGKTLGSRQNADIQKSRTPQREFKKPPPDQKRVQTRTDSRTIKPVHQKDNTRAAPQEPRTDEMPLNKFIAWSGVCGRREAAGLIKSGKVSVNGKLVTQPPHRVNQKDDIKVNGKKISIQKNLVYILLNKPKDYITTTDDPEGRKTVMDLIKRATTERVFPVGRLDRNTTGVLLLTNDGELAQRLTHPKYEVKKIYEVRVDKVVTKQQLDAIASGITLEDGFIKPDMVAYADAKDKSIIGIEIHSGRNRIVRRIFEHLGFDVKHLDRVMYGIFTKKNVERGKWRMLSEKEIRMLKHLNTSFKTKKPS